MSQADWAIVCGQKFVSVTKFAQLACSGKLSKLTNFLNSRVWRAQIIKLTKKKGKKTGSPRNPAAKTLTFILQSLYLKHSVLKLVLNPKPIKPAILVLKLFQFV